MHILKIFLVLITLNFSAIVNADECSKYVGRCDFYLCREAYNPCGQKGYYLGFSYKYCVESENRLIREVSEQGKKWIGEVTRCLQESVDRIPTKTMCSEVFTAAVEDHAECYSKAAFCSLPFKDQYNIIYMLRGELYHPTILAEGLKVLGQCTP